jgi:Flp pilus assembly protein TadD
VYVALVNRQPDQWYLEWISGADYVVQSKTAKLIDSLYADAVGRGPFVRFDLPCRDPGLTALIQNPLTAGLVHFRRDCYQFAVQKLREAVSADPTLARIAVDQGQIPTALQEAELAVGLKENDGVLRYDYGVLLYRAGKIAEAEEQFAKAVELEPY